MGLIRAALNSAGGVMADQWKEFFYCDAINPDILMVKGQKRTSARSVNRKGEDNIISNGSVIAVANGQAMAIVEQGKVVEFCAEPGEFVWDNSTEPSLFSGKLRDIPKTFANIGKRFTFGGVAPKDQRVYYFNLLEIIGNKYGTPQPVPFRVVDNNIGLDIDIAIRCNGKYSYRMTNPIVFFTNVAGNVTDSYHRSTLDPQLRSELLTALQPAFARISAMGIRYSALPGHTTEISEALNEILSEKWGQRRGIEVAAFGVNTVAASPEDEKMIRDLQRKAVFRNPGMAGAALVNAQAEAMQTAAGNQGGAMMGFMGLNMAQQGGGMNANDFFAMQQQQQNQQQQQASGWRCNCGATNSGRFCSGCGGQQPGAWQCQCGTSNSGRFCSNCGGQQPQAGGGDNWACECGTNSSGRFCKNCGKGKP